MTSDNPLEADILARLSPAHLAAVIRAQQGVDPAPGDGLLLLQVFDLVARTRMLH
jgi:hypothetical protein